MPRTQDDSHPAQSSSSNASGGLSRFLPSLPPSNPFMRTGVTMRLNTPNDPGPFDEDDDYHFLQNDSDHEIEGEVNGGDDGGFHDQRAAGVMDTPLRGSEDQLGANSSDSEESSHDFASERSIHSDNGSEETAEPSAREYTVQKLFEQLQLDFHGCTEEDHKERMRQHMESAGDNHHSLSDVFNDANFLSVLGLSDMITPERLARQQEPT